MGELYQSGQGVKQDCDKAIIYYKKAGTQGLSALGFVSEQGLDATT
ncbi:SEL1-like repeat protein [Helicobacter felis]|nr:SEL1-like repeat protein [Helicobacter felis]